MATYQAVIARYKEDIDWVGQLKIPYVIYNKGQDSGCLRPKYNVVDRPNFGRESETFLHHIIENYEKLPDYLVMLQGHPFDHCHNLFGILDHHCDNKKLIPLCI